MSHDVLVQVCGWGLLQLSITLFVLALIWADRQRPEHKRLEETLRAIQAEIERVARGPVDDSVRKRLYQLLLDRDRVYVRIVAKRASRIVWDLDEGPGNDRTEDDTEKRQWKPRT